MSRSDKKKKEEEGGQNMVKENTTVIPPQRTPIHTRRIQMDSFLRQDGLWELEATLVDVKAYDFTKKNGDIMFAGDAIHDMKICLTVTETGEIIAVQVHYIAAPYGLSCSSISSAYQQLVGMHLL